MKNQIKLNNEIAIDLPVLIESKLAVLANSGGGKSWAIRRIIDQAFGKVQIIVIDPEGEYGNMRKEFDFVLAGEGGETIAKPHIAGKLAERLMELKASAIVDLYDMIPQDRKKFVRLFLDSLMNLPKHMQTDMLLIIDEAHVFAPEGKPSEASTSMEALASQGRKRNIGVIFATQRIAKFSKDVLAECNNKMIGRMNLDIDRKRAGEELGFTAKEQFLSLRTMKPGEFHMFGPAISDEIVVGRVGDIKVLPPKRGAHMKGVVPPTAGVKKLIAQLADLPQEAERELKTVSELQNKVRTLEREIKGRHSLKPEVIIDAQAITNAIVARDKQWKELMKKWSSERMVIWKHIDYLYQNFQTSPFEEPLPLVVNVENVSKVFNQVKKSLEKSTYQKQSEFAERAAKEAHENFEQRFLSGSIGRCAKAIYSYLVMNQGSGRTKTQCAVATVYSQNSGGFNNALSELSSAGLIDRGQNLLNLKGSVDKDFVIELNISLNNWLPKLGACARKIWELMLAHHVDETWTKEQLGSETGYSPMSGGFNNALSGLSALGLIERLPGGSVRINPEIINL